jgi:hypothetical protein
MELAITKKIPWKTIKIPKTNEKIKTNKSEKDIIATFCDDSQYIYLTEPTSKIDNLYNMIKDMPGDQIKQMIKDGIINRDDIKI